ncbi:VOC family protein [Salinibius halmophilus]|uniref:VOC family protein n=1 Tax=Salinibius halmophilus TaxID=1853216 RepID=UPI001F3220BD|nr:VOC family protein [Salinibius halmophilus]
MTTTRRFECPQGGSTFSVYLSDRASVGDTIVYFEHQNLDELVASLKAKGIAFLQEPTDQPYLWREALLADPCGNKIKLYWAGENRLNPPWRLD